MSLPRRSKPRWRNSLLGLLFGLGGFGLAEAETPADQPVAKLGDQQISVGAGEGDGTLLVFASRSLLARSAGVKRVLVMIPGRDRAADKIQAIGVAAARKSPEILVAAPQFLDETDVRRWKLPADRLRWQGDAWAAGAPALGPNPISAFSALDALLGWLADPGVLPDLKTIVIAGTGAGGELVQRYAAVAKGLPAIEARGIALRYVVADAPSYLYFDPTRPVATDPASCPGVDRWPYGLDGAPAYVTGQPRAGIEPRYRARDVRYLLGPGIDADAGCAAAAEGGTRLERGRLYQGYLAARAKAPVHRLAEIAAPGDAFASDCGLAALLDQPGCPALDAPAAPPPPPTTTSPAPDASPSPPPLPPAPSTGVVPESADPLAPADPIGPLLTRPVVPSPPPNRSSSPG